MKKLTFVFLISLLGFFAGISGCGQKGSLYMPVPENVATGATEDVDGEANAKENEEEAEAAVSTE
jgi:predicted small lipoprotein YifL